MKGWSGISVFFLAFQIRQSDVRHLSSFGSRSENLELDLVCQGGKKEKENHPVKAEGLFCGVVGKKRCLPTSTFQRLNVFSSLFRQLCSSLQKIKMPKTSTKQKNPKQMSQYRHNETLECTQKEQTHSLGPVTSSSPPYFKPALSQTKQRPSPFPPGARLSRRGHISIYLSC